MRAAVFTEGSTTTYESAESFAEYFEGSFLSVNNILNSISKYCDAEVHILSKNHGYVRGEDQVELDKKQNIEQETEYFVDSLLSTLENLDVVIVLFTTDIFEDVIAANWDQIVKNAKEDSIWYIGTSRSALNSIELEALEQDHLVILYQRRGVARLGTETIEKLIEHIRTKADD